MIYLKKRIKLIAILFSFCFLFSCVSTNTTEEKPKPTINEVIDGLKNIPFPKL